MTNFMIMQNDTLRSEENKDTLKNVNENNFQNVIFVNFPKASVNSLGFHCLLWNWIQVQYILLWEGDCPTREAAYACALRCAAFASATSGVSITLPSGPKGAIGPVYPTGAFCEYPIWIGEE